MKLRHVLISTVLLAAPLAAHAQWYAGPALLTGMTNERDISDPTGTATGIFDRDDGNLVVGASGLMGYDFTESGMPMSLEFSGNWRARHDLDIGYINGGLQGVKSNVQTLDFMASLLYDIDLGYELTPYLGGGVGVAYADLESENLNGGLITPMQDSDTTNFAWSLQGGVKYPLDEGVKLRVDYRYVDLGTIETSAAPGGERFEADLYAHDVRLGVTWDF